MAPIVALTIRLLRIEVGPSTRDEHTQCVRGKLFHQYSQLEQKHLSPWHTCKNYMSLNASNLTISLVCFAGFQLCAGTTEMPLDPSEMEKTIEGSLHIPGYKHMHMSHDKLTIPSDADRRDIQPESQELYTRYFLEGTVKPMVECACTGCSNDST